MKHQIVPEMMREIALIWDQFSHDQSVNLFAKLEETVVGGKMQSANALARAATNLNGKGYNVYFHLNPTPYRGTKASTRHISHWQALCIDLDPIAPTIGAVEAIEEVLRRGDSIIPNLSEAAMVVDTGRGAQAWPVLRTSVPIDSKRDAFDAERAMAGFLHQLKREWDNKHGFIVDTTTSDLARIVRCAGTVNQRTGRRARIVRLPTARLDPEHVREFLDEAPEDWERGHIEEGKSLSDYSPYLNGLAAEYLHAGVEYGDRHRAANCSALTLFELGASLPLVQKLVVRGGERCRPALSASDALWCVETARKKYGGYIE